MKLCPELIALRSQVHVFIFVQFSAITRENVSDCYSKVNTVCNVLLHASQDLEVGLNLTDFLATIVHVERQHAECEMLLNVDELTVSVRSAESVAQLIEKISFSVGVGETLAIVGESGSGKTTLAKALTQLFPKNRGFSVTGCVQFGDLDLLTVSDSEMRTLRQSEIRYVFQEPAMALSPLLRLETQVSHAIRSKIGKSGDAENRIRRFNDLLSQFRIQQPEAVLRRYPHQLSIGTLQRIHVAIALAPKPRLLIADEPTSSVDASQRNEILDLLVHQCRSQGMGMILITHDVDVARWYADAIAVLYKGRIVEMASKEEFFERPSHPYSQLLLSSIPSLHHSMDSVDLQPTEV